MLSLNTCAHDSYGLDLEALSDEQICAMLQGIVRQRSAKLPPNAGKRRLY